MLVGRHPVGAPLIESDPASHVLTPEERTVETRGLSSSRHSRIDVSPASANDRPPILSAGSLK